MNTNWIDIYVTKITGEYFDKNEVYREIQSVVEELKRSVESVNAGFVSFDWETDKLKLPDCNILVQIDGDRLTFVKQDKETETELYSAYLSYDFGKYKLRSTSRNDIINQFDKLDQAINEMIAYTLIFNG